MKKRAPYIIKASEIESLLAGIMAHGIDKTYEQMKIRATQAMEKAEDIDEMFLDMYESMIDKARGLDETNEQENQLRLGYYALAAMLRRLAHEVHFAYLKLKKEKNSGRFLHLISDNPQAPTPTW